MPLIGLLIVGALIYGVLEAVVHLLMHTWFLLTIGIALWAAFKLGVRWNARRKARNAALSHRADIENALWNIGNPKGTYGQYLPEDI